MDAANVGKEAQRKANEEKTIEAKQVLLDNGCEIVENPDKEAFKEIAVSAWKVFTDEMVQSFSISSRRIKGGITEYEKNN